MWNGFAQALADCTLEWGDISHRTEETQKAWLEIVDFVINSMKEGYYRECRRIRKEIHH